MCGEAGISQEERRAKLGVQFSSLFLLALSRLVKSNGMDL